MAMGEGQCPVALQQAFVKKKKQITLDSNISNHCSPERPVYILLRNCHGEVLLENLYS